MRKFAAPLLLFALVATAQEAPELIFQKAISLHQKGDIEGAIEQYRAYLKLRPQAFDARSNLGAALASRGRYEEAIVEYQGALKSGAKDPRIWLNLALAFYKSGQISKAAEELSTLHKTQPTNLQVTLLLADCWLRLGENAKVTELLTPLEKENQSDLGIAYLLGMALLRSKQIDRGQQMIDRILKSGDSAEAHLLLGTARLEALDYPAAITDLEKAVALNPRLPDVYSFLGQAQMLSGNMTAARAAFEKEIEQNPNDFESNLRLAVLLKQDGDYVRSRELLTRALRVRPQDPGALYQVGAIELATGNLEKARTTLEDIVKREPKFLEAHVSLAQVYYRLKRKADGDKERELVNRLRAEQEANRSRGKVE